MYKGKLNVVKIISLILLLALLVSACGNNEKKESNEEGTSKESAENVETNKKEDEISSDSVEGKEVTMILKNLTNPFFITVKEGGEDAAKELGIDLTVLAPLAADSNEEQSQMAEQAIVNQVDCLIMCPADSNGIVPAMQKVHEAGIPIIDLNTLIGGDEIFWETLVGIENFEAGYQTVEKIAEAMDGEGEFFIIEGTTGAQTSIDRVEGALACLEEYPGIEVVAQQSGEYNRAKAMDVVQNLLQTYPDVKGIYCCNDEMALGTVEALEQANKLEGVIIGGSDGNDDALESIKEGKMSYTSSTNPYQQGYQSVVAAAEVLKGNEVEDFTKVDIAIIGPENVDEYIK